MSEEEFAALYRQHRSALIWQLRCCGASQADADDAVQDAFACALRSADQIRDHRAWPAWLRTVAVRCYLRSLARQGGAGRSPALVITVADVPDTRTAADVTGSDAGAQERVVLSLLAALPPRQRRVFALHYEGWGTAEIAAQLGMDQPAVRQNLARARAALRQAIRAEQLSQQLSEGGQA